MIGRGAHLLVQDKSFLRTGPIRQELWLDGTLIAVRIIGVTMAEQRKKVAPKTYWEKIQKVCRKHDVLIVVDEVICGFGRPGNMFGCETFDIKPDVMVVFNSRRPPISPLQPY
ncbi:Adenosylmethionine-8-amino-7-oxononanoate aminotransferase [Pseudomonas fluorescens]|nr:Adenosylmethionine-8-amino-7-oxononanoate aminotransferase [Pseudomonas fluorescens]